MDASLFYNLRQRLYSCAAAGCMQIKEDFRLKRAAWDFEAAAGTNKVFGKLAGLCRELLESGDPAPLLARCIALADAATVLLGTYSDDCETRKTDFIPNETHRENIPYSKLSEYRDYIRSGGYQLVYHCGNAAINSDPRVLSAFIQSLVKKSTRPDSAELLFPFYGKSIVPLIKRIIPLDDPKANGNTVDYIRELAGYEENDLYISLAENGNAPKEVRAAAVRALACHPSNAGLLMNIYRTGKLKLQNAALYALGELDPPEAEFIWRKIAEDYSKGYEKYFIRAKSDVCTEFIRKDIDSAFYDYNNSNGSDAARVTCIYKKMMPNKQRCDDLFLKFAEHGFVLNGVLIDNIRRNPEAEYRDMIKRLYAVNKKFIIARLLLGFKEDPEGIPAELRKELFGSPYIALKYLENIRYNAALGKYIIYFGEGYCHSGPWLVLTPSLPESILDFAANRDYIDPLIEITEAIGVPFGKFRAVKTHGGKKMDKETIEAFCKNIFCILNACCETLYKLCDICSPEDKERVVERTVSLVSDVLRYCPNVSAMLIAKSYPERFPEDIFKGLYSKYIFWVLRHLDSSQSYFIGIHGSFDNALNISPLSDEEKAEEAKELLKKIPKLRAGADRQLYSVIESSLKRTAEATAGRVSQICPVPRRLS